MRLRQTTAVRLGALFALVLLCAAAAAHFRPPPKPRPGHRTPFAAGLPYVTLGPLNKAGSVIAPPKCVDNLGEVFRCYSPQLIDQAYDIPSSVAGRGQTIVLIDAFGDATIRNDLSAFDTKFALPAPPSFEIVGPNGQADDSDPDVFAWEMETALDVEWAHAIAPAARVVLVVTPTDDTDVMNAAEAAALPNYPRAIVSHSFGSPETDDIHGDVVLHRVFVNAQRLGDTLVAGAGDFGATNGLSHPSASYPASDPLVLSVGGTEGLPYPNGLVHGNGYGGEQVWNEQDEFDLATGGSPSVLFPAPSWQLQFSRFPTRTVPDVSFDAAVNGGVVIVVKGFGAVIGGTSVGSPSWAAIVALANEGRANARRQPLGFANPSIYAVAADPRRYGSDFHDITVGNNALDSPIGFSARRGYDFATGLGTPDVANLIGDLAGSGSATASGSDDNDPSGDNGGDGRRHDRHPGR